MNRTAFRHAIRAAYLSFAIALLLAEPGAALTVVRRIPSAPFSSFQRDRFIDAQSSPQASLAPSLLLTHEMGVNARIHDTLTSSRWAKVVFDLPSARVQSAELLFYVDSYTIGRSQKLLRLLVNGRQILHRTEVERMLTGGWDRTTIPAEYLQDGVNEFIFADSGLLHVDPGPGGNSSRSFDAGSTWSFDALGPGRDLQGEYMVRLRLRGYAPAGQLTSPVVDLADPDHQGRIAPRLQVAAVRLDAQQQTPEGTRIEYALRTGPTPAVAPQWSDWQSGTSLHQPGRYVQWRATLSTAAADRTPALASATLEAELEETPLGGLQLLELDQPEIAYSSYPFTYMAPHPRVTQFVEQEDFASAMAAGASELDQFAQLRDWVHRQWLGWQADKYPFCPSWDPLEILHVVRNNLGFGMCTHYAAVFVGSAASLGYAARSVIVDHHCLVEIWSEDLQKWILQDPGPATEYNAHYTLDGVPINALELHRSLAQGRIGQVRQHELPLPAQRPISQGIADCFVRFGIPLRNDYLTQAEPAELEHGYQQYKWDGYLWWTDEIDPRYAEYSLQSSRLEDFYPPVNQTRIYLQAADDHGLLRVDVETSTPNLSHFLVQVDDGDWAPQAAPLNWPLHTGENTLAVRSVNLYGRQGRVARARVLGPRSTAVQEERTAVRPQVFALDQNHPNPFNGDTVIDFSLPAAARAQLAVYNAMGQRVATLLEGARQAGTYTVRWDGRSEGGDALASGAYLYRLQADAQVEIHKLLLLR